MSESDNDTDSGSSSAGSVIIIGKHRLTGKYTSFDMRHLDHSNDEVKQKLAEISEPG